LPPFHFYLSNFEESFVTNVSLASVRQPRLQNIFHAWYLSKRMLTLICYPPYLQHKLFLVQSVSNTENLSICFHILLRENKHVKTFRYFHSITAEKLRNIDDKWRKNSLEIRFIANIPVCGILFEFIANPSLDAGLLFTYAPYGWLEVSNRKVLRPAISTQVFLGFPGS
jgi:hypothetical protein